MSFVEYVKFLIKKKLNRKVNFIHNLKVLDEPIDVYANWLE